MKRCPFCAEEIQDEAVKCRFCGAFVHPNLMAVPAETDFKATLSLILGIFFFFLPTAVAAIVLGHVSRREIKRSGGRTTGAGRALAGLILGYAGVASLVLVLILAAIVVPLLQGVTVATNHASVLGSLRDYSVAEDTYASTYKSGYSATLGDLGPPPSGTEPTPDAAGLVDSVLSGGSATAMAAVKSGYKFTYLPGPVQAGRIATFQVWADPIPGTPRRAEHFFIDQTGVIRHEAEGRACQNSPQLMW